MPEQAEWLDGNVHRWHEVYARCARQATTGGGKTAPVYDLRTLGERVTVLEAELSRLRALLLMAEGNL